MYGMPDRPSDTVYVNINKCFNIKWTLSASYTKPLSSVKCSEVLIHNDSGGSITFKAGQGASIDPSEVTEFSIPDGNSITVMGLTNTDQLSCAGSGTLFGRSHFYSSTPQVRQ